MNIVESFEQVNGSVKAYILAEMEPGGLLEDVETFIKSRKDEGTIETPCVWLYKHPTVSYDKSKGKLSNQNKVVTPFEFVCIDYEDDLEDAEELIENLVGRVGASIQKNFNKIRFNDKSPARLFVNVEFNSINPEGEVEIRGKAERVPAASIILDFVYYIDWLKCNRNL